MAKEWLQKACPRKLPHISSISICGAHNVVSIYGVWRCEFCDVDRTKDYEAEFGQGVVSKTQPTQAKANKVIEDVQYLYDLWGAGGKEQKVWGKKTKKPCVCFQTVQDYCEAEEHFK
jgi:hypothetical protein